MSSLGCALWPHDYALDVEPFMMLLDMHGHDAIERLGRWIAGRASGEVRLVAAGTDARIVVVDGKVVSARGLDPAAVAQRLEVEPSGRDDILAEAVSIAERDNLPQGQTVGAAKEVLQEALAAWLADDGRRLEFGQTQPSVGDGPTISLTHAIVEVVLSDSSGALRSAILPDLDLLPRRADRFLELYSPLRLSEEADLIVAKVTGQRTVREICDRSPHGIEEVHNLLAALVCTGILDEAPLTDVVLEPPPAGAPVFKPGSRRRRIPIWIFLVTLAALLLAVIVIAKLWPGSAGDDAAAATRDAHWAIVVDMGCEPQDLQRVLKKSNDHPKVLKPLAADAGEGSPCWRLVWGTFDTSDAASRAIPDIPKELLTNGFTPHPVELSVDGARAKPTGEEG